MFYSLWCNTPTKLRADSLEGEFVRFQATDRQHRGCIYTTSCNTQYSAPEDGRDQRPKRVELIGIVNKLLLLHLVGVYIIYNNDAWSNKYKMHIGLHAKCAVFLSDFDET